MKVIAQADFDDYSNQSKLYSFGYNVKANGLSKKERRDLLVNLYETKKMSDFEIRRDLNDNIHRFENYFNFVNAVEKWKDDLWFFINYLKMNTKF